MAVKVGDTEGSRIVERREKGVPISTTIVEAIAALESVEPLSLDISLYEAVDLDALDALSGDRTSAVTVAFVVEDYRVEVANGETVVVERLGNPN